MNIKTCVIFHILILTSTLAMSGPLKVGFSTGSYSVIEESGSALITVQLSRTTNKTVTVDYATSDGTASGPDDYTLASGTLNFAPGQTAVTFVVHVIDDSEAELDETINLMLSNPSNARLGSSVAVLTILDPADGDPQQPPLAQIGAPVDQSTFVLDSLITMEGSTSTVPAGFQVWFAALDANSGSLMTVVHPGSTLSESFTAAAGIDAYTIRLVIADPAAMPGDNELRGEALPCTGSALCDSTEVNITRTDGPPPVGPYFLEATALSPFSVKLTWEDPAQDPSKFDVYRGETPEAMEKIRGLSTGYTTYYDLARPNSSHEFIPGSTYFYQVTNSGGASEILPISIPTQVDPYLSLLPTFGVSWTEDSPFYNRARAIVNLDLWPEDPVFDPTGCTVDLWVDDTTAELPSLEGEPNDDEPAYGRGDLSCLVAPGIHIGSFTIDDPGGLSIDVPDLSPGEHTFRYRVTAPSGESLERAFIQQLNSDSVTSNGRLFGDIVGSGPGETRTLRPFLFGFGSEGRLSPDCQDADSRYFVSIKARDRVEVPNSYYWPVVGRAMTDETGYWEFVPDQDLPTFDPGDGSKTIQLKVIVNGLAGGRYSGRRFPGQGGEIIADLTQRSGISSAVARDLIFVYSKRANDNPVLDLAGQSTTVLVASTEPVAYHKIRFRVVDFGHNLVLSSVSVRNSTLDLPAADVYMRPNQIWGNSGGLPEGAYWEAEVPFTPGANEVFFSANDGKKSLAETVTFDRAVPRVVADIASPGAGAWNSHALIHLDGTTSDGPPDMEVRWVFLLPGSGYSGVPSLEASTLETDIEMPEAYRGLIARLVVATPGNLPANLYSAGPPCTLEGSGGLCDSAEIQLNNACCTSSSCDGAGATLSLNIVAPDSGQLPINQNTTLQAEASGVGGASYAYRWSIADLTDPGDRTVVTPVGSNQTGFDASNASYSLDPVAQGLAYGTYYLTAEAGLVDELNCSGPPCCIGSIVERSIVVNFSHTLSAVSPGQVFPTDTIRVYGETFTAGEDVLVRIDDDSDHVTVSFEILGIATDERWVDVQLPFDIPAGTIYYVAVAAVDGTGESTWKQALEVVHPGFTADGTADPSCGAGGQETANPIVPGQVVTGDFCGAGDTDYFYFPAVAGTTIDVSLERVDETLSVFHPESIDPELFVVTPNGIAPAEGYTNDVSAENTDAVLSDFMTTETGLYSIACRTSRAAGAFRLTVTRTSTPTNQNFEVVPYGDRAIAVVPQVGSTSSASLQALAFDPQGLPAAGAALTWQNLEGTPATTAVYSSSTMGLGQGTFTLDPGASTTLKPTVDWPNMASKNTEEEGGSLNRPRPSGALLGFVRLNPFGEVTSSHLVDSEKAQTIVKAAHNATPILAAEPGVLPPSKVLSSCTDPTKGAQKISEIEFPPGAASIEGFSIEFTDQAGTTLASELQGYIVEEHHDLGVRLIAHCLDDGGQPFDAPLASAPIALGSSGETRPDLAGGIVRFSNTCQDTVITAVISGDWTPFTHEVGKRAILSHIDDFDQAHFLFSELLSASVSLKAQVPDGGWTILRGSTDVEIQPQHGEPAEIRWLEPKDLLEVATGLYMAGAEDPPSPATATVIEGPQFYFLDGWGNKTPLWGRDDSRWRWQSTDEISLSSPGVWGTPPWVGIDGRSGTYQPFVFVEADGYPPFSGFAAWEFCAYTSSGDVCDTFSLDNTGNLNVVNFHPPWPQECSYAGCNSGGYITDDEAFDASSWKTCPGGPLIYHPSGKPVLIRVHPVNTDDLEQPHSQPFSDVPVKVWLNGPKASASGFHTQQQDAGDDFEFLRETDVEFCTGVMTQDSLGVITATCDQIHQEEAFFTASTDQLNPDGSGFLGNAIGITKAPAEPGWYTIMVETDDPAFNAPGQRKYQAGWSFVVIGGRFLDTEWQPYGEVIEVPEAQGAGLRVDLSEGGYSKSSILVNVVSRSEDGTELGSATLNMVPSHTVGGVSVYFSNENDIQLYPHDSQPAAGFLNDLPVASGGTLVAERGGSIMVSASIDAETRPVDLDLDSDNDEGTSIPRREPTEDVIEASPLRNPAGKFVFVNHNDDDFDGRPDYADLENPAEATLVPIVLELNPDTTWDMVSLRFEYDGLDSLPSMDGVVMPDPRNGQPTQFIDYSSAKQVDAGEGVVLSPALRIWNVPTSGSTRTSNDYIVPGQPYSAAELGFDDSNRERVFFLEGLNSKPAATDPQPTMVTVVANIDGSEISDEVLVTVVEANLGVNNSNNRSTLRPGVPDADFVIDEYDELVEDQGDPDLNDGIPAGGFEFWNARPSSSEIEHVVDLFPAVIDVPEVLTDRGFRTYLRLESESYYANVFIYPNPSPRSDLRRYLSDVAYFSVLQSEAPIFRTRLHSGDLEIELSGNRTKLLWQPHIYLPQEEALFRVHLVIDEPSGDNEGVVVDSVNLTIKDLDKFFWMGSSRGEPNVPFQYRADPHINGTPGYETQDIVAYPHFTQLPGSSSPDPGKNNFVVYIHGYNVDEGNAGADAEEMYRRLFWAGYRGNFVALTWQGDDRDINLGSGGPNPPALFYPNVENAFRTSPSLEEFLSSTMPFEFGAEPQNIYLVAHSLGNLVAWDALRLHSSSGTLPAPIIRHFVSVEAAVWSEAFWSQTPVHYPNGWSLSVEDLRRSTWAFWFNQDGNKPVASLERSVNSYSPLDDALMWMRINDIALSDLVPFVDTYEHCVPFLPNFQRIPVEDGLPTTDPGNRPDLAMEIPALVDYKIPADCIEATAENLAPPLGTIESPLGGYSPDATEYGWLDAGHSDFLELSLPRVWAWYEHLFFLGIPGFEEGILPADRE